MGFDLGEFNEAHLSAEQTQKGQDPRFPAAYEDRGRTEGDLRPPEAGTQAAGGLASGFCLALGAPG